MSRSRMTLAHLIREQNTITIFSFTYYKIRTRFNDRYNNNEYICLLYRRIIVTFLMQFNYICNYIYKSPSALFLAKLAKGKASIDTDQY